MSNPTSPCPDCGAPRAWGRCPFRCGAIRRKEERETMKKLIIEIHANEGGEDARDLVRLQADIYRKLASRRGL